MKLDPILPHFLPFGRLALKKIGAKLKEFLKPFSYCKLLLVLREESLCAGHIQVAESYCY